MKVHKSLTLDSIVGHMNVVHSSATQSCEDSNKLLHSVSEWHFLTSSTSYSNSRRGVR